jgi:hypothetical protein
MASDLRAVLAAVAEFLPVEGVPEMVVYDHLYEQADLGTIDEQLRQLLLARSGTVSVHDGTITRRLGRYEIIMTPDAHTYWSKDSIICRGGDLPATEGPAFRAWRTRDPYYHRMSIFLGEWAYSFGSFYRRRDGLPSYIKDNVLVWYSGSNQTAVMLNDRARGMGTARVALTPAEVEHYTRMAQQCMSDE